MDKTIILEQLFALSRESPNLKRNTAMVESYLDGESISAIAKAHRLSPSRVDDIIRRADDRIGGGILKGTTGGRKRIPSVMMMEMYPHVWDIANELGLSRQAAAQFYRALGKIGSLADLHASLANKPRKHLTKQITDEVIRRG